MAEPEVASDPDKMRKLGRRHAELGVIVSAYTAYKQVKDDLEAAKEMASEDPGFRGRSETFGERASGS